METITIKKATIDDAIDIADIHMLSWEVAYKDIIPTEYIIEKNKTRPAQWQNLLLKNDCEYFIIQLENNTIGFITLAKPQDKNSDENYYELVSLYLHPDYCRKGFGTVALNYISSYTKALGEKYLILFVLEDNHSARLFYEKNGFLFDGTKKTLNYGKPLSALRYRRELA
ncbi:MAG: hypothetical protein A2Y17_04670 [Clostridiales bacterium GWF2_38_85]|nr:MAG: hypothetical protein A2Y17_04670 [Clostridiales bacterium GWF2_38_85]HBL84419.1 hypothetical protein [Clostridiales bacterium]